LAQLIRHAGERHAVSVSLLGIDLSSALARAARDWGTIPVCGDGLSLPFRSQSVDLVVCSQLLHHFTDDDAVRLLGELDRVARHRVIVCDLRRSRVAAAGFWLASHPLGFHPVTRHDGVASVRRGFTAAELTRLVHAATRREPVARRSLGFRLAVSWHPERIVDP
jgi:ubiquinone/menaquinone biosynthesis C-methylase UbiE